jgi:hypothetical protein
MELRFEARILQPKAEYIKPDQLREGDTYFIVDYADPELLLPTLTPVVFIGSDVEQPGSGHLYFQDIDSYRDGVRLDDEKAEDEEELRGFLHKFARDTPAVMDYESAVDELLRCYIRRDALKARPR